jgi:predicted nucleic acid-binding protein
VASDSIVVADSSPLIALARIGRLELLTRLVQRVLIPPAVQAEIRADGDRPGAREVAAATWIQVEQPDPVLASSYGLLVDRGEAEAIALAKNIAGSVLLIDDRLARRLAERLGIPRIGTVGVLLEFRRREWTPSLRADIDALLANGIYLRRELIDAALRAAQE